MNIEKKIKIIYVYIIIVSITVTIFCHISYLYIFTFILVKQTFMIKIHTQWNLKDLYRKDEKLLLFHICCFYKLFIQKDVVLVTKMVLPRHHLPVTEMKRHLLGSGYSTSAFSSR